MLKVNLARLSVEQFADKYSLVPVSSICFKGMCRSLDENWIVVASDGQIGLGRIGKNNRDSILYGMIRSGDIISLNESAKKAKLINPFIACCANCNHMRTTSAGKITEISFKCTEHPEVGYPAMQDKAGDEQACADFEHAERDEEDE